MRIFLLFLFMVWPRNLTLLVSHVQPCSTVTLWIHSNSTQLICSVVGFLSLYYPFRNTFKCETPHSLWCLLLIEMNHESVNISSGTGSFMSLASRMLDAPPFSHSSPWTVFLSHHSEICDEKWWPAGWASSVDSLYSQPGVMSMPRALKLTLIAALKIITKQQEAADVSGPCTVAEDRLMPGEIYSGGQSPGSSEIIDLILPLKCGFIS